MFFKNRAKCSIFQVVCTQLNHPLSWAVCPSVGLSICWSIHSFTGPSIGWFSVLFVGPLSFLSSFHPLCRLAIPFIYFHPFCRFFIPFVSFSFLVGFPTILSVFRSLNWFSYPIVNFPSLSLAFCPLCWVSMKLFLSPLCMDYTLNSRVGKYKCVYLEVVK